MCVLTQFTFTYIPKTVTSDSVTEQLEVLRNMVRLPHITSGVTWVPQRTLEETQSELNIESRDVAESDLSVSPQIDQLNKSSTNELSARSDDNNSQLASIHKPRTLPGSGYISIPTGLPMVCKHLYICRVLCYSNMWNLPSIYCKRVRAKVQPVWTKPS